MQDFLVGAVEGGAGPQLQEAAGVGGNDGCGARGSAVAHFLSEQI